jgi:HD-GYP domain-containing protein (c-di-GMP phosphodiesterase class II)
MKLTAEQIVQNWEELIKVIEDNFKGTRKQKLLDMYKDLEDRMSIQPASSIDHYHNAFEGGYVDHVLRVTHCAKQVYQLWKTNGADMSGYTEEELVFVALNHDIGKMGFPGEGNETYIPNDSEWHRKNMGKIYSVNPNNQFTLVNDLSIWLLQHYGISISWNEMLGIKLTDGLYDENNKPYFMSKSADSKLKTNLGYIVHQADCMAARIEYEKWNISRSKIKISAHTSQSYGKQSMAKKLGAIAENSQATATLKMFDDLFGDKK